MNIKYGANYLASSINVVWHLYITFMYKYNVRYPFNVTRHNFFFNDIS